MAQGFKKTSFLNLCRHNRRNKTEAEEKMWMMLRSKNLDVSFRQQHQIGNYIVDFVCLKYKLIVECDGAQHSEKSDKERTEFLKKEGYTILRFWNNEILSNIEGCVGKIKEVLNEKVVTLSKPLPSRARLKGQNKEVN